MLGTNGFLMRAVRVSVGTSFGRTARLSTKHEALTDTFGRFHNYLRISLTEKCNLRCAYCMPEEGVHLTPKAHLMTLPERKRLISLFASLGVTKLRFTGGEPTISKDLEELIRHGTSCGIKSIGITSNGIILKERLDGLINAGMTSVNISLDTLVDTKFAQITRRDKKNIYRVLSSVYTAVSKGLPVKINCVLMRGFNDDEFAQFVDLTKAVNVDVRFIELMPFDGNAWKPESFISYIEVVDRLKNEHVSNSALAAIVQARVSGVVYMFVFTVAL
jgi:cyclic pyranopterin phosphate synthase